MREGVVPNVDCSSSRAAALAVTPLFGVPTCTCSVLEVGDPAPGLITSTATVPAAEEVPAALSVVDETKVVVSIVPPKITCAPFRKFDPLTEIVKFPTGMGEGNTDFSTGRLLSTVTCAALPVALDPDVVIT